MSLIGRQARVLSKDIWDGLRAQPARAGLAFVAIAMGFAVLTVLLALVGGLREKAQQIARELGVNVIGILQERGTVEAGALQLQEKHASLLALHLPGSTVSTMRVHKVSTLGTSALVTVVATDHLLIQVRQWTLLDGRFLDPMDMQNRERNAVVSESLSRLWHWKVGTIIVLEDVPFRVVGVVRVGGGALDTELSDPRMLLGDKIVVVPKTTLSPHEAATFGGLPQPLDAIFIRVPAPWEFARVLLAAQRLLAHADYRPSHISWVTPESLLQGVKNLERTIIVSVGSIAVFSLILGGTTLVSLMVANVKDRVIEIGLRRAMGASQRDIALLFLLEAFIVTGSAAVTATVGTGVLLPWIKHASPVPLKLEWTSLIIPIIVAMILGGLSSYWPAKLAATITPSEALRNE